MGASAAALAVQAVQVAPARAQSTPVNPIINLVKNTATGVWESRVTQLPVPYGQRISFAGGLLRGAATLGAGALRLRSVLAVTLATAALTGIVLPAIDAYLDSKNTTFDPATGRVNVNEPQYGNGGSSTFDDIVTAIGIGNVGWYNGGRFYISVWSCPGGYDFGYCPTQAAGALGQGGQAVALDDLVGQWRHVHTFQMGAHGTGAGKVVSVYSWRPGNGQTAPTPTRSYTADEYADKVEQDGALDAPLPDAAVASVVNSVWAASENAPIPYNPAQPVTASDVATARGTSAPPTLRDLVKTPWTTTDTWEWPETEPNPNPDPNENNGTWADPPFNLPALNVPEMPGPQEALDTILAPLTGLFPDLDRPKPPCPEFVIFDRPVNAHCVLETDAAQPALRGFGKLGWSVSTFWMFLEALK